MASTRSPSSILFATRRWPVLVRRPISAGRPGIAVPISRRFLNTDTAPILYSARAKVKGARTGHVEGDDLRIDLTMAKALGGSGDKGKTNPEELFAAGYGACFQSAMNAVAPSVISSLESEAKQQGRTSTTGKTGQSDRAGLDSIEGDSSSSGGGGGGGGGDKSGSDQAGKAVTTGAEGTGDSKTSRTKPKMPGDPEDSIVDTTVHLVGDMKKLDMGIRVDMKVGVRGLPRETTEKIVKKALEICPYSRAIKGNVTTNLEVVEL